MSKFFIVICCLISRLAIASDSSSSTVESRPISSSAYVEKGQILELPDIRVKLDIDKLQSSGGLGASDILAGLAFLVSLIAFGFQVFQFNKQRSLSIKETFWMREVIIPRFLERFLNFIDEAPQCYQSANDMTDFYQTYAIPELNFLKDATGILNVGKAGLGIEVYHLIESFDDDVSEAKTVDDLSSLLNDLAVKVVKKIQVAQEKI